MAEIYNFWTSLGLIQTSNITQFQKVSDTCTVNFSTLHKIKLQGGILTPKPQGTSMTYANQYKILGFTRDNNTFELMGCWVYVASNVIQMSLNLYKNGVNMNCNFMNVNTPQIDLSNNGSVPNNLIICNPVATHYYSDYNCPIYDYNSSPIIISGSSTTVSKGSYTIGFVTDNFGISNTYKNYLTSSSNGIRGVFYTVYPTNAYLSQFSGITNYDNFLFWTYGNNVNYTFEDDISEQGGGFGDGDNTTDNIDSVTETELNTDGVGGSLPTVLTTNIYNAYAMTGSQLQNLANVIFDNDFITALKNLINTNPLEGIISLKKFPVSSIIGTNTNIVIGSYDTEVQGSKISAQYKTIDCGTIYLNEKFGNFLDYNPNTKISIYLPFVGIQPIDVDLFMQCGIKVLYNINLIDGAFICNIIRDDIGVKNTMYTFSGTCTETYALTQSNNAQIMSSIIKNGVTIGLIAGVPQMTTGMTLASLTAMGASGTNTDSLKDKYTTNGVYSGNTGIMNNMKPYLIIERPQIALPDKIQQYKGFPSYITKTLSDCKGYTVVDSINLSVNATEQEKQEIEKILKEGVII